MKTTKFLLVLILVAIISGELYAKDNKTENQQSVNSLIKKEIGYPALAIENQIEGTVVVQYRVSEDGKIIIERINYENVILGDYVKERLSKIELDKSVFKSANSQVIKFDFKLI